LTNGNGGEVVSGFWFLVSGFWFLTESQTPVAIAPGSDTVSPVDRFGSPAYDHSQMFYDRRRSVFVKSANGGRRGKRVIVRNRLMQRRRRDLRESVSRVFVSFRGYSFKPKQEPPTYTKQHKPKPNSMSSLPNSC
jgi:hypothetical protein